jgi:hypothetical protein
VEQASGGLVAATNRRSFAMHRPLFAAVFLIASLAACQAEGTEEPATETTETATEDVVSETVPQQPDGAATSTPESGEADDNACGADKLDRWLNVLPTDEVKAAISEAVGERPIRYYTQGDPITMDFSPARLNVELGEDGRIKLFRCG